MSLGHGPKPVIDGLILNYDLGNFKSYSGSGITINNLIQTSFGATTSNSPTFSSSNLGYLTFAAASSQFGTFPDFGSTLSNFTVEVWFYLNSLPSVGTVQAFVTQFYNGVAPSNRINFSLGFNGTDVNGAYDGKINAGFYLNDTDLNLQWWCTSGFTPTVSTWYQSVMVFDGSNIYQYTNGVQEGIPRDTPFIVMNSGGTRNYLMRRWDDTNFVDGRLAIVRIYNKSLSASEIRKNYDANKKRFGLT